MDDWLMPGIPRTIAENLDMEAVRRIRASVTSDTGQVVESDLLLDCPFCGGRPWVQVHELGDTCVEARVVCGGCHVSTSREYQSWKVSYMGDDLTRTLAIGRAISSWNRRAERTCHVERVSTPYHGGPPRCSACMMPLEPLVNYCPYCGARVVGDDDRRR